ncbi:MAG: CehA/McbA family metallohydrolase [Bryobacteraceae bacterium]
MRYSRTIQSCVLILSSVSLFGQSGPPAAEYRIYAGSTHAHTAYTWSHGEQFAKNGCAGILVYGPSPSSPAAYVWSDGYVKSKNKCPGIYVINSYQYPSPGVTLRPDWKEHQGPPSEHFRRAKADGYDFYVSTDHSQEAAFQPPSADNPTWASAKREAAEATDGRFAGLAGFEYSENDGPGGVGHLNVINSAGMLNALAPGVDLPHFYQWLETAAANGEGPVVASFNHPGPEQYNNWAYRDSGITDIITMLEVINSNNKIHYAGFVNALDRGWKVSPVCGNDNHGLAGIARNTSRTFVLANELTKAGILDAMKHRRTYASLDKNIQCRYTVNGAVMGSTLDRPTAFRFVIAVNDPDAGNPNDKITKIDIVKDGGAVAQTYTPTPGYSIRWSPILNDSTSKFFFVRVWTAGGGDAPGADPANPVAWLAPVWTGR